MKYLQHETNARNDVKMKQLRRRYGLTGYAVYFVMLEIIGENVRTDNIHEWGSVDRFHTLETLADELNLTKEEVSAEKLKEILLFCNELDLFQKKEERLFCKQILKRLDEYSQVVQRNAQRRKGLKGKKQSHPDQLPIDTGEKRVEENRIEENKKEENLVAEKQQHYTKEFYEETLDDLITLLETELETKVTNRGKQLKGLKMILDAGFTVEQTKKAIVFMAEKDEFFQDKGFDLITVANQLPRYKAEARKGLDPMQT